MRRAFLVVLLLAVAGLAGPAADAKPMNTHGVPLERLLKNIAAYQRRLPDDPAVHYALGRAHYAAFSLPAGAPIPVYSDGEPGGQTLPGFPQGNRLDAFGDAPQIDASMTREQARYPHVLAAIAHLREAVRRAPTKGKDPEVRNVGLYSLTLACVLETGAKFAPVIPLPPGERALTHRPDDWLRLAAQRYRRAFDEARPMTLKQAEQPIFGYETYIAYEAGASYLRLARALKTPEDPAALAVVEEGLARIRKIPPSMAVTPIVFSIDRAGPLEDLLDPAATVAFDLDGTGRRQRWTWVRPDTVLLVWDPERGGKIASGRQLFGSATFWMFFPDGYRALDALDDSRDGWLTGRELAGLALWFDRNQNGVSDPGEVVPIERTPVVGIACRAAGNVGASLVNPVGLRLRDGRWLPTYDWVATSR